MPAPPNTFFPGWHPDLEKAAQDAAGAAGHFAQVSFADDRPLPKAWSLSGLIRWPFDQGQVGSCFANATTQCAQIDGTFLNAGAMTQRSRWLTWYQGRKLDGSLGGWGDGGSVTNAMLALSDKEGGVGSCPETDAPYQASHGYLEKKPPRQAFDDAGNYKCTELATRKLGDETKREIYNARAVGIGIWWPYGWDSAVDSTGRATGIGRGTYGHALAIVGWHNDWQGALWWQIENSHGPIYHPVPQDVASEIEGYKPIAVNGRVYSFWVRDDWLHTVFGYGQSEALSMAGPGGFKKNEVSWDDIVTKWTHIF